MKRCLPNMSEFPAADNGVQYEGKTLFLGGGKSHYIPTDPKQQEAFKTMFINATFQHIPDAGHWGIFIRDFFLYELMPYVSARG